MKKLYFASGSVKIVKAALLAMAFMVSVYGVQAQTYTFHTHSYIINMGIIPQTNGNGLKPYGLLYDLIKNYQVPVYWVIGPDKVKDGKDFTYNGVDYKGGTFIIPDDYITTVVAGRITYWNGLGVSGAYTTGDLTLTYAYRLTSVPTWTLDDQNGAIATGFFSNAGMVPANVGITPYDWLAPSLLGACNDIFVMPHADPAWATHGNLYNWNLNYKGSIWLGCHAGSALANMYNPVISTGEQCNFLMNKITSPGTGIILPVNGSTNYCQNSLILWGNHAGGSIPYNTLVQSSPPIPNGTLATAQDPVAQYMGVSDLAHLNGSEQIYLPVLNGGWLPSTKIICYDPSQTNVLAGASPGTAVLIAYGKGFGDQARGYVMYEAGHSINKGSAGDVPAQRAFFNWSLLAAQIKTPVINSINNIPEGGKFSAQPYPQHYILSVSYTLPVSTVKKFTWICRRADNGAEVGEFFPNGTSEASTTQFTPPNTMTDINVLINVKIEDQCGRTSFESFPAVIKACNVSLAPSVVSPSCYGGSNGSITLAVTGGVQPYNWIWTKINPAGGSGSGTGTTLSGLAGGTYSITLTDASGCTATVTSQMNQPAQLVASVSVHGASCFGTGTGSVNLTVSGGTFPYTYDWDNDGWENPDNDPKDLLNVASGIYNVMVTDAKGCTATATATVGQPSAALTVPGVVTNISCFGRADGAINITASGGTVSYTYNWGGGIVTEDRSGLSPGTYNILVTDANGCTATNSFTVTQPQVLTVSPAVTNPTCVANPPAFDGSVTLATGGGTSPYVYDWSDIGSPGVFTDPGNRTGLGPGTYSVTVKDSHGCTATSTSVLTALHTSPVPPAVINH